MIQRVATWVGLVVLLVGAWLSLPRFVDPAARPVTAVLRDRSPSARFGFEDAARFEAWLQAQTPRSDDRVRVRVLDFAERVALGGGSALGTRSHVDLALRELAALEEREFPGRLARVLLLSDGSYTGPDPSATLAGLAARGVAVEHVVPPFEAPDVALLDVDLAPQFAEGADVGLRFDLGLTARDGQPADEGVFGLVEVEVSPFGGTQATAGAARVAIWPPTGLFELTPAAPVARGAVTFGPLAEGAWHVRVLVDTGGASRGRKVVTDSFVVGAPKRVLVAYNDAAHFGDNVEARVARARAFFAPPPPGLAVELVPLAALEPRLAEADLLVTWDVPLGALPGQAIAEQVDVGMGWLALGSFGLLDVTQPVDPQLAAKLPMVPDDANAPARRVILCVDGSGSMSGAPFEAVKRAALELVRAAPARDEVALAFFTGQLGAQWLLRPAQTGPLFRQAWSAERQADELRQMLASHVPGGDTRILDTVRGLIAYRKRHIVHPALVILLSDGAENSIDLDDPLGFLDTLESARELAAELRSYGTALSVISIRGGAANAEAEWAAQQLLQALVEEGESVIDVDLRRADGSQAELANVFSREVAGALVLDGAGRAALTLAAGPDDEVAGLAPLTAEVDAMGRYRLRRGARVVASAIGRGGEGGPLVALREGVGRVALLASEPGSAWAPKWTTSAALEPLLAHLARGRESALDVRLDGGALLVEGLAGSDADLVAELALDGKQRIAVELAPDPLRAGLFRAALPATALEAHWARVDVLDPSQSRPLLASLSLDLAADVAEFLPDRPRWSAPPPATDSRPHDGRGPHASAPGALFVGLLLVFAAFLARP